MRIKVCAGIVGAALLLAGCSTSNELTAAGQSVRFVEDKPGSECQLLGTATGEQSNWMSGQHGEEGGSMRGAANALRNQAAAMGGNVIYGVSSPTQDAVQLCANRQPDERRSISARTDITFDGAAALSPWQVSVAPPAFYCCRSCKSSGVLLGSPPISRASFGTI